MRIGYRDRDSSNYGPNRQTQVWYDQCQLWTDCVSCRAKYNTGKKLNRPNGLSTLLKDELMLLLTMCKVTGRPWLKDISFTTPTGEGGRHVRQNSPTIFGDPPYRIGMEIDVPPPIWRGLDFVIPPLPQVHTSWLTRYVNASIFSVPPYGYANRAKNSMPPCANTCKIWVPPTANDSEYAFIDYELGVSANSTCECINFFGSPLCESREN